VRAQRPSAAPASLPSEPPSVEQPAPDPSISLEELWQRAKSRTTSLKLRKLLAGSTPRSRRAGVIVVSISDEIAHLMDLSRDMLEQALAQELGEKVRLEVERSDRIVEPKDAQAPQSRSAKPAASVETGPDAEEVARHPLVRGAMELFDAEIVQVRPKPKSASDAG